MQMTANGLTSMKTNRGENEFKVILDFTGEAFKSTAGREAFTSAPTCLGTQMPFLFLFLPQMPSYLLVVHRHSALLSLAFIFFPLVPAKGGTLL